MKTYIEIHAEPDSDYIRDGKTGNPRIDGVVKSLYEKFSVFQLKITTNFKFDTGFKVEVYSHDDFFGEIFGVLRVEYQFYTHTVKSGEHHYRITCHKKERYEESKISEGFAAYGNNFEEVLTAFLMETGILFSKHIAHLEEQKKKLSKMHVGKYDTEKAGFSYVDFC